MRSFPDSSQFEGRRDPEARTAHFFARALVPEVDHWIWFRPTLPVSGTGAGRRPFLVLLGPPYGLLVLEIAPWRAAEIVGSTDRSLLVRTGGRAASHRPRPEDAAREAATFLTARLGGLRGSGVPAAVGWGAVYPFLSGSDAERQHAEGTLDPARAILREDLTEAKLPAALARLSGGRGKGGLDLRTRERIRAIVEPQLHFLDLREEAPPEPASEPPTLVAPTAPSPPLPGFWLDRKQERMARELASPRTLVYGPAGSGKTVFLVARAQYWLDRNPGSRVLFTCYNASLASHLRRVFAERGMPPDDDRLTVRHYHDLCGRFLGLADIHERSPEFYAALEPRVLRELTVREDAPAYDCILVDEGQDFTRRMIEVLVRWNANGGEITVVCDPAQDVYGRWRPDNLGPLREPAVEHLVDCYRNTAPIFALAMDVLPPETRRMMGLSRLEMTRPEDLGRDGPPPELRLLEGLDELIGLVTGIAAEFEAEGRPVSELAVLYTDRGAIRDFPAHLSRSAWRAAGDPRYSPSDPSDAPEGRGPGRDVVRGTLHVASDRDDPASETAPADRPHFAEALESELRARGVPAEWISRDFASKSDYDITRPRLTLSTIHSAKGMDFHTVILLGAETLSRKAGRDRERAEALLFTGITRARERLVIPYFAGLPGRARDGWIAEIAARLG